MNRQWVPWATLGVRLSSRPHPKIVKDDFLPLPEGEVAPAAPVAKTIIAAVCDETAPQRTSPSGRGLNLLLGQIQGEGVF